MTNIKDGKGRGYLVEVNSEQQLMARAVTESDVVHHSHHDGNAFGFTTPLLTVTTTLGQMLWFRNDDTGSEFRVVDVYVTWDGGSTTYNKPLFAEYRVEEGEPTTNITAGQAAPLNRQSTMTADLSIYYWDETGTGMTGGSAGATAFYGITAIGTEHFNPDGYLILGYNDSFSLWLRGVEAGEASINVVGYFSDPH